MVSWTSKEWTSFQTAAINEVNEAKLIAQSQPTSEDLQSVVEQVAVADIKQKELEKLKIRYDMYYHQKKLDEYNDNIDKRRKLNQEIS